MTAETVAESLLANHFSCFGTPLIITTDQGGQFLSDLFEELTKLMGSYNINTTAYNPKANGMVERFHRTLKGSLEARSNTAYWSQELPLVLLGVRTALKDDLKCSAAEMLYGQPLRIPGELFVPTSAPNDMDTSDFIVKLRDHMRNVLPTDSRDAKRNIFISKILKLVIFFFC